MVFIISGFHVILNTCILNSLLFLSVRWRSDAKTKIVGSTERGQKEDEEIWESGSSPRSIPIASTEMNCVDSPSVSSVVEFWFVAICTAVEVGLPVH